MSPIVVTGGAGFLGRHIVRALAASGKEVRVLDRLPPRERMPSGVEFISGDVGDKDVLERVLAGAQAIVHLACTTVPQTSEEDRIYDIRSNVEPALLLMECAVRAGVRRLVFASSGGTIYGVPQTLPIPEDHPTRPICSHGIMKLAIEGYLWVYQRLRGIEGIALRMGNPYGPGQGVAKPQGFIGVLARRIQTGQPVDLWGDGSIVRDFVFVDDVAEAYVRVASGEGSPGPYNIGSGMGHSVAEVIAAAEQIIGRPIAVRRLEGRLFDVEANVLDIAKARRELGWDPRTGLLDGLKKTLVAC